jgi:hypothetical protein
MMVNTLVVAWRPGTPFLLFIQTLISRTSRRWRPSDPLEALSEVYLGVNHAFNEGEIVDHRGIIYIRKLVSWRVTNHYKRRGDRRSCQLVRHSLDDRIGQEFDSGVDTPADEAADRELREMVDAAISAMPARRAEAVRSRLGYPGVPEPSDLARRRGTTRQSVYRLSNRGLEELRYVAEKISAERSPMASRNGGSKGRHVDH